MSTEESLLGPPRGMRDFYPEDMIARNAIFDAWRASATKFGFQQYDSCVVESLATLKRKSGEEISEQIYAFADKSGRELALRPEMTPTLARMISARQSALPLPLKWFAIAQCFRYERMTRGRKREHYQWNLDIIGEQAVTAETEVVACAIDALLSLGLTHSDVLVHFSSRALLGDLLTKLGISRDHHQPAFLALDKRGKFPDDEIRAMLTQAGVDAENVNRIFQMLSITSFDEVRTIVGPEAPSCTAVSQFMESMKPYGIGEMLKFDISVIRGLSYYTGIVFEAFDVNRKFRAIFGGGRYDNLLADMGGTQATGVGLGFGDVVVAEVLSELAKTGAKQQGEWIAVGFMFEEQRNAAASVAAALRKQGKAVDLGLRAEKAKNFFSRTGRGTFCEAVYIGPDDMAKGTVRLKNLATRTETELRLAGLV